MKSRKPICLSPSSQMSFLFCSIFVLLTTSTVSYSYGTNESDHLALLSFKSMITEDPYGVLSSWNTSFSFCDWSGVSCGKRHKRVTVIQLDSQGLKGSLSSHVGNLSFLRELRLSDNNFEGIIPPELGRLSRLRLIDLFQNKFSGPIPANLSGCSNLEKIWLGYNKLNESIPNEIGFLSKLTLLQINDNNLTGGIPPLLGNITTMELFSASGNPLGGSIPHTLGQWKNVRQFHSGNCQLIGTIPDSIYNLSLLTNFTLAENQLTGSLPLEIGSMLPNLLHLQLRDNQLSGLLPPSISNCSKLDILEMTNNNFTGELNIEFGKLKDITNIYLSNNNFNFSGGEEANEMKLIDSLGNCSKLEVLSLGNCNIQGVIPASIGNLSRQLEILYLGGNKFYGHIPSSIGNLVGLSFLALPNNQFTGKIPFTIGLLEKLQVLSLEKNQFSGPIPDTMGNLSFLNTLILSSNRLEEYIPSSLGNCLSLTELYLDDNKLNGEIPKQLLQLPSLSIALDLSRNNLTSSLPTEIGGLKTLTQLDISYNKLSGTIPDSLGSCVSLSSLSLKGNLFQGMIPPSFISLRGLEVLDLSQNNLSGQIPSFFEPFSLLLLNLSNNDLEGEVPVLGVFANSSIFLILGNPKLCGGLDELQLPKCKLAKKDKNKIPLFIIGISVASTLFAMLCFVYVWRRKKTNTNGQLSQSSRNQRFLQVSYNQLLKATDGFSEANLIGRGGFSSVYKGSFDQDAGFVAIKVLHLHIRGAHKSFVAECEAWRSIRHRNVLKIITSCSSVDFQGNDFKALVYEFMPNGSLHDWLHSSENTSRLNLLQRINILIDVASALDYLHNHCQTTIVHGDLKPSNILLDNDMVAHVGDFGLARFLQTNSNQNSSTGVKGTIGYAPPEYGLGSEMTSSGDVYSFGILLLVVMTSKKPTDDIFDEGLSLHKFACDALPDHVINIIDVDGIVMKSSESDAHKIDECLVSTVKIGVSCSVDAPSQRMNISNVLQELLHILDALQNL